jgi:putative nucleotidyltransferase with HDIG domain
MHAVASLSDVPPMADEDLFDALLAWAGDGAWRSLVLRRAWRLVVGAEPPDRAPGVEEGEVDEVVEALARLIDAKAGTPEHSLRVAACARGIARGLGMSAASQRRLYRAGLLHDIGKLGVPDRILEKPGPLTPREKRSMDRHPIYTWKILSRVPVCQPFARMAALHHERLDGGGYPWKLSGARLDREARILAVAQVYEGMTSPRSARLALPAAAALSLLREEAGIGLDAEAILGLTRHLHTDAHAGHGATVLTPA